MYLLADLLTYSRFTYSGGDGYVRAATWARRARHTLRRAGSLIIELIAVYSLPLYRWLLVLVSLRTQNVLRMYLECT